MKTHTDSTLCANVSSLENEGATINQQVLPSNFSATKSHLQKPEVRLRDSPPISYIQPQRVTPMELAMGQSDTTPLVGVVKTQGQTS